MRHGCFILALCFGVVLASSAPAQEQNTKPQEDSAQIEKLIGDLGSPRFVVREKARATLEKIGQPALEALRKAVKSDDMEVSETARKLVEKLEQEAQTAELLRPTEVHLKLKDTPADEAFEELARQSGFSIQLQSKAQLAQKKITLDTGKTTFWQAFDQLCREAGVVDQVTAQAQPVATPYDGVDILPIQPRPAIQPRILPRRAVPVPAPQPQIDPKQLKELIEKLQKNQANPQELQKELEKLRDDLQKKREELQKKADEERKKAVAPALPRGALQVQADDVAPAAKPAQAKPKAGNVVKPAKAKVQIQGWAAPAQVQIQIQQGGGAVPVPAGPVEILPDGRIIRPGQPVQNNAGQITVRPGTPADYPTYYAGALRIQVLSSKKTSDGLAVKLRITPEPGLDGFGLTASPTIIKALDNNGQQLEIIMDSNNGNVNDPNIDRRLIEQFGGRRIVNQGQSTTTDVTIRFRAGDKESTNLKELAGKITAQVLTPPKELVVIKDVLNAKKKKAKDKEGNALQLVSISNDGNGRYTVQVNMEANNNPFGNAVIGGNVIIRGNVIINGRAVSPNSNMPELVDKDGKAYQLVNMPRSTMRANAGQLTREMTLVFQAPPGADAPDRLRITGRNLETVQFPFRFENVPVK